MATPFAIGCGVVAGLNAPLLARDGDPTGGLLAGQQVRLPVAGGLTFGFSWVAFAVVALVVRALLAAARNR